MRCGVIIQARAESTRLKDKLLMPIGSEPVLSHVAHRALRIDGLDAVCFAVSEDSASDAIAEFLNNRHPEVIVTRGSENDVLARYDEAARRLDLDAVMRITSDCPLIDPFLCTDLLTLFIEGDWDYVSNNLVVSFPHGLDCEVFSREILARAAAQAVQPAHREHVTGWMRDNAALARGCLVYAAGDDFAARQRWTVDYAQDLQMLDALMTKLPRGDFSVTTALETARQHPQIVTLNEAQAALHPRRRLMPLIDGSPDSINRYAWQPA